MVQIGGVTIHDLEFSESSTSVTTEYVRNKLNEASIQAVDAYVELLAQFNGGQPNKKEFRLQKRKVVAFIDLLCVDAFGFLPNAEADVLSVSWHLNKFGDYVPVHWLIIGIVTRDDFLLLDSNNGSIGFIEWNAVMELPNQVGRSAVIPVADSIGQFLSQLQFFIEE